jgi:tRNA (guanine37-N1)-methyltransferase
VRTPEPVVAAVRAVRAEAEAESRAAPVVYLSPQGELLRASLVDELAALPGLILLCGSYEGIDERAIEAVVDREISIGDYVLTGGEPAALVLINAVARKLPGVLGNEASAPNDSFERGLLDWPHYTRPPVFEGRAVPEVLLGGHHAEIEKWRLEQARRRTAERRPDLLANEGLTDEERKRLGGGMKQPKRTT